MTGLAPEFGASTAFSAVALVVSAASSTLSSALAATLVGLGGGLLRDRGHLVGGVDDGLGGLLEHVLEGVLDGVDGPLGATDDPAEAGLAAQVLDDLGAVLGELSTVASAWVRAVSTRLATVLRSASGRTATAQLRAAVVRAVPAASVARVRASLTARSAWTWASPGSASALRAELVDDGLGALDGQVTGADDGEDGVVAVASCAGRRRARRTASRSGWGSC